MPSNAPNKAGQADRLKFVTDLFVNTLKITPRKIEPVSYDEEYPFPYNNYVFFVETKSEITAENRHGNQPGTTQIPPEHSKFVVRLPNPESTYNNKVRVENEVAALMLARQAIGEFLVPRVFAWGSTAASDQRGWVLEEFMSGKPLRDDFPEMSMENQQKILNQMADILKGFQQYKTPASIRGYGGLTFDSTGQVIIGPTSFMDRGPFTTYDDLILGIVDTKLARADQNKVVAGWIDKNIRARLDKFIQTGLKKMTNELGERTPTLVHADFTTDNLLYDPSTTQITAVIDFDFSHIGTVADDFFRSLERGIGTYPDPRDGDEMLPLSKAMLTEFPNPLPESTEDIQWTQAKAWDDALRDRNMYRPGNIQGMEAVSSLFWLTSQLLPHRLAWDFIVENSGEENVRRWKASGEEQLDEFLTQQGFS